jgi:hypothetical protein
MIKFTYIQLTHALKILVHCLHKAVNELQYRQLVLFVAIYGYHKEE